MAAPKLTKRSTLATLAVVTAGVAVGLGGFTFVYAKGYSYLGCHPGTWRPCNR